jgi:hypothetical protein
MLQPAPSPLAHSRSSPAADARPLYATVLAVAGNAAGMCSGTVLFIGIINVINHILLWVGILQNIFIHFCIVQSSFLFVSFQVLAVGHWSYCLLCYCQLWHAVTVSRSHCLPVLLRSLSAVCHPVGFHPLTFRARLFRLRRARSAYLAILITIVAFIII